MSYCAVADVLDAAGLDYTRIIALSDRIATQAQADILINDYIRKATREVKKALGIPITVHCELHEVDEDIANYTSRVYLGNFDESYCEYDEMLDEFDVQGLVQRILRVYVGGVRVKKQDDTYPWTWTRTPPASHLLDYDNLTGAFTVGQVVTGGTSGATGTISADDGITLTLTGVTGTFQDGEIITDPLTGSAMVNGETTVNVYDYINFTSANLVDGDFVQVTYTYDPYAITVPVNVEEATACLAGLKLLDMLIGTRVIDTDVDAQSESGVSDPTKDKLIVNRSRLKSRYRDALASEGYGFNFVPMRGE